MDREEETKSLTEKLVMLKGQIKGELDKIGKIKTKLSTAYRRRDKENYETERKKIAENLKKYESEMDIIEKRLSELEIGV